MTLWYAQRARTRDEPSSGAIAWTGRRVFYRQNVALVAATQKALFEKASGESVKVESVSAVELDAIDDGSPEPSVPTTKQTIFHHFQAALALEWQKIGPEGQKAYDALAVEWRERGPTPDEKKRSVSLSSLRFGQH